MVKYLHQNGTPHPPEQTLTVDTFGNAFASFTVTLTPDSEAVMLDVDQAAALAAQLATFVHRALSVADRKGRP